MFKEGPECGKPMKGLSVGDRSVPPPPKHPFYFATIDHGICGIL